MRGRRFAVAVVALSAVCLAGAHGSPLQATPPPQPIPAAQAQSSSPGSGPDISAVINKYCLGCHSERLRTGGLVLEGVDAANPATNPELWERVIVRLRAGSMPPAGLPRPDATTYDALASRLESESGSRLAGGAESRPHQRGSPAQSDRIQERDPGSVRPRRRRRDAFARRRNRRRQLRQLRRRPHHLHRPPGALSVGGATGDAPRRSACPLRASDSIASRFRFTSSRTIVRAKTCRSGPAAASRFRISFRSMAST